MSEMLDQRLPEELQSLYAKLNQQDVEQFYAGYQLWRIQQQITALQSQIAALQQQIAENTERMQKVHPSALALAVLARLSASGVTDIDLLDRMLERGEEWLDRTLQHLDYCEQIDLIGGNYVEWCELALEGAYDWIESMQDASAGNINTTSSPPFPSNSNEALVEATEELLLQKLTSDEEEYLSLEPTLKRPAIVLPAREEPVLPTEEAITLEETDTAPETIASDEEVSVADNASEPLVEQEIVKEEELLAVPLPATEEQVSIEVSDVGDIAQPLIEEVEQQEQEQMVSLAEEAILDERTISGEQEEISSAHEEGILDEPVAWEEQGEFVSMMGEVVLWETEADDLAVKQYLQQEEQAPEPGEAVLFEFSVEAISDNIDLTEVPIEQIPQQEQKEVPPNEEIVHSTMDELPSQQEKLPGQTSPPARRRRWWAWWRR